jgi:hypothetical protein
VLRPEKKRPYFYIIGSYSLTSPSVPLAEDSQENAAGKPDVSATDAGREKRNDSYDLEMAAPAAAGKSVLTLSWSLQALSFDQNAAQGSSTLIGFEVDIREVPNEPSSVLTLLSASSFWPSALALVSPRSSCSGTTAVNVCLPAAARLTSSSRIGIPFC